MSKRVVRRRLSDFGQYREQLRFWDTDAVQLSSGPLSINFDCAEAGDIILSHLTFDRDASTRSVRAPGWHALVVNLSSKRWCGIDLPAGTLLSVPPDQETRAVSREPWNSITVLVRQETLAGWGASLAGLLDRRAEPASCVLSADLNAVRRFCGWTFGLFDVDGANCNEPLWWEAVHDSIRHHLVAIIGDRDPFEQQHSLQRVARYDLAVAALRLVGQETERRLSVSDISCGLGVSERAIQYAFTHVLGISPAKYLLATRLNRARRHLVTEARSGASVTTTAFDHQFENLSRFAQQYLRLFGERPSETLRNARAALREPPISATRLHTPAMATSPTFGFRIAAEAPRVRSASA